MLMLERIRTKANAYVFTYCIIPVVTLLFFLGKNSIICVFQVTLMQFKLEQISKTVFQHGVNRKMH